MSIALRVLIVEDSDDDALLLIRELQQCGYTVNSQQVDTAADMLAALEQQAWDMVIADYNLPQFSALEALKLLQAKALDLPFIIVSGAIGEDVAVAAMHAGAHDYVMKDKLARLGPATDRELREAQERHHRRQVEQALQASEEQFRTLIENVSDIIMVLMPDGTIWYASPSVRRVLGYEAAQLTQNSMLAYIHPDDARQVAMTLANVLRAQRGAIRTEFRMRHQSGLWQDLEAINKLFLTPSGEMRVVVNARDITERKQAEAMQRELIKERELRELKIQFFSMMSHQLKNPLGTITAITELVEHYNHNFDEDKRHQYLQMIRGAVQEITDLLEDTLVLGKADSGGLSFNPTLLDLPALCSELADQIQVGVGAQHQIEFSHQGTCTMAWMDGDLLRHVFANLLSNAVKYSPPGATIQLDLACQNSRDDWHLRSSQADLPDADSGQICVVADAPCHKGIAIIRIRDQGIGIPETDQTQLFKLFHRGSNVGDVPGTGLGLAIVKQCVDLHQGDILVESQPGVGTTFTVTLPLQPHSM